MKLSYLATAWLAGLLLGMEMDLPLSALGLFTVAAASGGVALAIWRMPASLPVALAAVVLLGVMRGDLHGATPSLDSGPDPVVVQGTIISDPIPSSMGVRFDFAVEQVDAGVGWEPQRDRVRALVAPPNELVQTREAPYFKYGDRLQLTGSLVEPEPLGDFDYPTFLANQGIHWTIFRPEVRFIGQGNGNPVKAKLLDIRRELAQSLNASLPEPHAGVSKTLLLGVRSGLNQDVEDQFRTSGTSHMLAISGLHVGVILVMALWLGTWLFGRRWNIHLVLAAAAIWVYALIAGLPPSAERAAIMGTVYLAALGLGRSRNAIPPLALAAVVMTAVDPGVIKQTSFHLSFAAMAGIAVLLSLDIPGVTGDSPGQGVKANVRRAVTTAMAVSLVATVATLPLVAFNFQQVPTLGILVTLITLPFLPLILVASGTAAVGGLINDGLGEVLGWIAWAPLEYLLQAVGAASKIPGSAVPVPEFSGLLVWTYYGALAVIVLTLSYQRINLGGFLGRIRDRPSPAPPKPGPTQTSGLAPALFITVLAMTVLAGALWHGLMSRPDDMLRVRIMDVGQGDAILVQAPSGAKALIDGGAGPGIGVDGLGRALPFWDRRLDIVVLTHADLDHFGGLAEVVRRYDVERVIENGLPSDDALYKAWRQELSKSGAAEAPSAARGQRIELGGGAVMEVLGPPSGTIVAPGSADNNNGIVMRLVYGEVSFLLAADIEEEAELELAALGTDLRSSALKVAHHGSRTSTTPAFLRAVNPAAAVVSVGADNRFGHPHAAVIARLDEMPGRENTYLTSEHGDVEFTTDGQRLWVKTQR